MNSKRQMKSQPKKSTENEFVFTEPQPGNNGNFRFTEPAKKKSKLMIFLIAGGVVLLLALSILAVLFLFSHKKSAEESQLAEVEANSVLTSNDEIDIFQKNNSPLDEDSVQQEQDIELAEPPEEIEIVDDTPIQQDQKFDLDESQYKPGDRKALKCDGQTFIFRWCPAGSFTMGKKGGEHGEFDKDTRHHVTLTHGFWLMETEVTLGMFKAFVKDTGYTSKGYKPLYWDAKSGKWEARANISWHSPGFIQNDNHPVTCVSWDDAVEFCEWLRNKTGQNIQLPTEAQWEYACRAGTTGNYAGSLDAMAWYDSNSGNKTHPVRTKKFNAWGLYDMHGNVSEWCQDWKNQKSSDRSESVTDPVGPDSGIRRILRGGNWHEPGKYCGSGDLGDNWPEIRKSNYGFRCALVISRPNDSVPAEEQSSQRETASVEEDKSISIQPESKSHEEDVVNNNSLDAIESKPEPKAEPKAGDTLVKEIDRVQFVFKWIPAGIFTMGSPSDEEGRNPNERQYKVKISKGFWMMDSEVTQEQWMAVTGDVPSSRASFKKPKENVSWYDCNNFCKKAASAGLPLELPTEAQWEYACRAGTKGPFAGDFEEMTWHYGNSDRHAQNIRTKTPNQWGLYDMHGNVAEWVADWCGVYPNKPTKDPKGPDDGDKRMTRGGSWGSPKHFCRSALRGGLEPDQHTVGLGFRCVLNSDQDADGSSNYDSAKRPTSVASNALKNREAPDTASNTNNRGDCFVNRSSGKARAVAMGGGTTESERAVGLGLQWIANHQLPNGAWSFNHQLSPSCRGACNNPGKLDKAFNGATGLAMLPFLGAGVTHNNEGKYKTNVDKGINYLCLNGKQTKDGCVSFLESGGTIYSHGIVALCLTEAYGMTKDKKILPVAQGSLNYIYFHQDPNGGGWRYQPHQEGDASATGWQVSAIKTGYMSGLEVPKDVIRKASQFLSSVQTDSGAKYGYTEPGAGPSTTSVGLLCRMYFGWRHDNPALQRGVEWLSKIGPSKSDSYYNYYATQVMYQYNVQQNAGPMWKKWNAIMRDLMVNSQSQQEHAKGSWYHSGPWSERGGRLYDTALSIMVLETYYRYPSVYKSKTYD